MPLPPPYRINLQYLNGTVPEDVLFNIDTPKDRGIANSLVIEIAGWVAAFDDVGLSVPTHVDVRVAADRLISCPISLARPDVSANLLKTSGRKVRSLHCGFSLSLPVHLLARGGPYTLSVRYGDAKNENSRNCDFAQIEFTSVQNDSSSWEIHTSIRPLIITTLGRSGSSLLCRMLAQQPHAYVPMHLEQYGEVPYCGYLARLLAVLSSQGRYSDLNKMETQADFYEVGPPNFCSSMLRGNGVESNMTYDLYSRLAVSAKNLVVDTLKEYIAFAQSVKPNAKYVVEKNWNSFNINLLRLLFPTMREVFVVRSPESFLKSEARFAIKEKRDLNTMAILAETAATRFGNIARSWLDRRSMAHLIRFEDLVDKPGDTLHVLSKYLEIDHKDAFIKTSMLLIGDNSAHTRMVSTEPSTVDDKEAFTYYLNSFNANARRCINDYSQAFGYTSFLSG